MKINPCGTLDFESTYRDGPPEFAPQSEAMLRLISSMRTEKSEHTVFALTSHEKLCLLSEDSYDSHWWVTVECDGFQYYRVEYLMKPEAAPWDGAYIVGTTQDVEKAVQMVLTGMINSGGWMS